MAEAEEPEASDPRPLGLRIHAVTGVVPLSLFLVEHILVNASALWGGATFDAWVGTLARSPLLPAIEIVFVLIPLAFHAFYGLAMTIRKVPPIRSYPVSPSRMVRLQRLAGLVLFAFIAFHLWELRLHRYVHGLDAGTLYTRLTEHLSYTWSGVPVVALAYFVALAAVSFHFAAGLAAYWIDARDVTGRDSRRNVMLAFAAGGVILFAIGALTVIGVATGGRLSNDDATVPARACGSSTSPPAAPAPSSSSSR
jgi:succinate dehydrogenase/fumarate reductase cytochrome b subunit (b558 family)